ncbi:MAG TPA: hypothetical protein VNA16_08255 [Abditibacteriaceae bacterium]|nr:hypothetical protein [Abditibacteriaceae bacterium]
MRRIFSLRLVLLCLSISCLAVVAARAQGASDVQPVTSQLVTNAAPADLNSIRELLGRLDRAVAARDATSLRFFGITGSLRSYNAIKAQTRLTHVAVTPAGALVRQAFQVTATTPGVAAPTVLGSGVREMWLSRVDAGGFALTDRQWTQPVNAATTLIEAAREEWDALAVADPPAATAQPAIANSTNADSRSGQGLLQLVAERRGGRWIALRRTRWDGALVDNAHLLQRAGADQDVNGTTEFNLAGWLRREMLRVPAGQTGAAHFFVQRGPHGWVGLGTAWQHNKRIAPEFELAARAQRSRVLGAEYVLPAAHRDLAIALARIGLFAEAADEAEKTEALQPGLLGGERLRDMREWRANDPQALAARQLENEAKVGLGPDYPVYVINALTKDYRAEPTSLGALRLALEYSKLADDRRAGAWLKVAEDLAGRDGVKFTTADDVGWAEILFEHLRERQLLSAAKPPNLVRSALFTVRCWPNDLATLQVLAALESAQHTVYAGFGIPMGNTEVVVWRTQSEFQRYTTQFSKQGASEFVAALTLTKLISTEQGPLVLGEEVNFFIDSRANTFSTIAHEYGHVAVRQLSRGRTVPVWFNEGIATAVEGGYDGYLPRVRRAAKAGTLITMREMLTWDVDGERAFLAYSQANSMLDFIIARWSRQAVLDILRKIGTDVPADEAFRTVLGVTPQELWNRWAKEGIK